MEKLETYCQTSFLDYLFDYSSKTDTPSLFFSDNQETLSSLNILIDLIFNKSNLLIDNYNYIIQKAKLENVFYDRLIKSWAEGGSQIISFDKDFAQLISDFEYRKGLNSSCLCLLNSDIDFSKEGLLTLNLINWKALSISLGKAISLKVDSDKTINEFTGWSIIRDLKLPINAALIADRYIHSDLEENLFQIIDNLLPTIDLKVDFHLGLIINSEKFNKEEIKAVTEYVNAVDRSYTVKFSIFIPNTKIHDRNIITNYFRINSGHSIDYYNKKGRIKGNKSTTLDIYGIASLSQNAHFKILKELKSKLKDAEIIGSGRNRLLNDI